VHLREAVSSIPRGVPAKPAVSNVDIQAQGSDAPHLSKESVQHPIEPATPGQDLDHDVVESLGRVVHVIKTVMEKSPETSEVRVWMSSYSDGISQGYADILFSFALMQTLPGESCLWPTTYGTVFPLLPCANHDFASY